MSVVRNKINRVHSGCYATFNNLKTFWPMCLFCWVYRQLTSEQKLTIDSLAWFKGDREAIRSAHFISCFIVTPSNLNKWNMHHHKSMEVQVFEKWVFVDTCFLFNMAMFWDGLLWWQFLMDVPAGCRSHCSAAADLHIPVGWQCFVVQESSHVVSKVNSSVFTWVMVSLRWSRHPPGSSLFFHAPLLVHFAQYARTGPLISEAPPGICS